MIEIRDNELIENAVILCKLRPSVLAGSHLYYCLVAYLLSFLFGERSFWDRCPQSSKELLQIEHHKQDPH